MTCEYPKKATGLKSWETWALISFILLAGMGAGYPLGQYSTRASAAEAIQEVRTGYGLAANARLETLNLCLAQSGQAIITANDAAKIAGDAAEKSNQATKTAAKAADAAAKAVEAATGK